MERGDEFHRENTEQYEAQPEEGIDESEGELRAFEPDQLQIALFEFVVLPSDDPAQDVVIDAQPGIRLSLDLLQRRFEMMAQFPGFLDRGNPQRFLGFEIRSQLPDLTRQRVAFRRQFRMLALKQQQLLARPAFFQILSQFVGLLTQGFRLGFEFRDSLLGGGKLQLVRGQVTFGLPQLRTGFIEHRAIDPGIVEFRFQSADLLPQRFDFPEGRHSFRLDFLQPVLRFRILDLAFAHGGLQRLDLLLAALQLLGKHGVFRFQSCRLGVPGLRVRLEEGFGRGKLLPELAQVRFEGKPLTLEALDLRLSVSGAGVHFLHLSPRIGQLPLQPPVFSPGLQVFLPEIRTFIRRVHIDGIAEFGPLPGENRFSSPLAIIRRRSGNGHSHLRGATGARHFHARGIATDQHLLVAMYALELYFSHRNHGARRGSIRSGAETTSKRIYGYCEERKGQMPARPRNPGRPAKIVTAATLATHGSLPYKRDMIDFMQKGGLLMWPIFFCSVLAGAIFLERVTFYHRISIRVGEFLRGLSNLIREDRFEEARNEADGTPGPVARVVSAALQRHHAPRGELKELVHEAGQLEVPRLERRLGILATVAFTAPLLGLLGTVLGLIDTFVNLSAQSGYTSSTDLASGIYQALLATAGGLIVTIPSAVAYGYLNARVNGLLHDMERAGIEIVNLICDQRGQSPEIIDFPPATAASARQRNSP